MARRRPLREFELYVLMAVAHLGDEGYGVTIRREIETRAGRSVAIGAVYATLARLEAKGLVRFSISPPLPVPGGRSRKYVRLTASGAHAMRESTRMFLNMLSGLEPLVPVR